MSDFSRIQALPPLSASIGESSKLLDVTLSNAKQTNPDMERQYLDISSEYDMPVNFVKDNFDSVQSMIAAKKEDPKLFASEYPSASKWFSVQNNANLASDSIEQLKQYEKILSDVRSEKEISDAGGRLMWAGRAIGERAASLTGNLMRATGKALDIYEEIKAPSSFIPEVISGIRDIPNDYLKTAGAYLANADLGTPNIDTWANYKDDPTDPQKLADFLLSQSGSVVDMLGAAFALPVYLSARTEEIAQQRAENKDAEQPDFQDYQMGTVTAVVTSLVERLGAKAVLGSFMDDAARLSMAKKIPFSIGKAAVVEGGTEFVQEGIEYVGETTFTNKELSIAEAVDRGLAGLVGGVGMGSTMRAVTGTYEVATDSQYQSRVKAELDRRATEFKQKSQDSAQARQNAFGIQQAINSLREAAATGRGADIQSLSQSIADNGGPQNLSFSAQSIMDAATKSGLDVGDLSLQLLGSRNALSDSAQAQTAVTIPIAKYMSSDLAIQAHEQIADTMLVDDNQMAAEDSKEFDAQLAQILADSIQSVNEEWNQDDSMVNDIYQQLIANGQTESYARSASSLYRFMNVMIDRGVSQEFLQEFDLSIGRDVPESLRQHVKGTEFNSMLDDLRNGRIPEPKDYMGQNLIDFVIENGGLMPDSDLDAMDSDVGRVGRNRITKLTGLDPDVMAERAFDAGYINSPDLDVFMEAMGESLQGNDVYSEMNVDTETRARAEALERVAFDLEKAQIDINELANEEINRIIQSVDGETLQQTNRGSIEIDSKGKRYRINLTDKSDFSTFLHESGHFFFEVVTEAYNAGQGDANLRSDYENLINELGGETGKPLTVTQIESFAEMFEQYLREGKAPSQELKPAFQTFKVWLMNVYKSIKQIFTQGDRQLNDEVRGIMDRMLATDAEIEAANDGLNLNQLFEEKPEWFTDELWYQYQKDQMMRKEAQESNLNNQKINEIKRANKEWWKSELKRTESEVSEEVDGMPVYQLLTLLRSKEPRTPSGEPLEGVVHYSLNKQATINLMGDVFVNGGVDADGNKIKPALPKSVYQVKGRTPVPPQLLFDSFSDEFTSPFDMMQSFATAPTRERYIKDEANRRMNERHGNINTNQADAYVAAVDAAHDEVVEKTMVAEINAIAPAVGGYTVTRDAFRRSAQMILSGLKLNAIRPNNYRRAEIKHGNLAFKAVQDGDMATAKKERELQLLNFYLYNQATKVKEAERKGYEYARSMGKGNRAKVLQKAGDHYLDQMASILNQYEFRKMSNKQLQKRKRMQEWLRETLEQAGAGNPTVNDEVATEGEKSLREQEQAEDAQGSTPNFEAQIEEIINYRELNPVEFAEVINMIESVYSLAKLKNKLLKSKDKRDFEDARAALINSIIENGSGERRTPESITQDDRKLWEEFITSSRIPASVIRELDGFKDGGSAWDLLLRPLQEGEAEAATRLEKAKGELETIWKGNYTSKDLAEMQTKKFDPVVGREFSRYDALSFLMNWGTESNRDRVMTGHGLNQQQVNHLFDSYLTETDFKFANEMWAHLETYWEATAELHKDFYGYTPDKVEPIAFETKYGRMTGGYYPILYNPEHSARAEQQQAKNVLEKTFSNVAAKIQMGSTKQRTARGLGKPLLLDVNKVTTRHVFDAVRRTSMDRAIYDAGRMISDEKVKKAIVDNHGVVKYRLIRDAILKSRDGIQEADTGLERILNSIRNNASLAMLGYSMRTIVLQPFGLTNSMVRLGLSGVGRAEFIKGYTRYAMNPADSMAKIRSKSEYMRNRETTQNAEIARLSKQMKANILNGKLSKAKDFIRERAMLPMMKVQLATVDAPTWLTAYENYRKVYNEDEAIQLADQAVRDAQGGGDTMDIAKAMNGNAWVKLFTNFLSYMMTTYNLQVQNTKVNQPIKSLKSGDLGKVIDYVENTMMLMVMPAVLNMLLNAFTSGEVPEEADEWAEAYLKEQGSFILGMNPITAQASGIFTGFDYSGPQGLTIIGKAGNLANAFGTEKEIDEVVTSESFIKNGIWVTGLATGLPAAQINRSIWGAKQALDNNEPAGQVAKQAVFGKEYGN